GNNCIQHCWNILKRNIQVPCIGLKSCPAFIEVNNIASNISTEQQVHSICTECFELFGGHLHVRQGSGKTTKSCIDNGLHKDDATLTLNLFADWILEVANSGNDDKKKVLLWNLVPLLKTSTKNPDNIPEMTPNPLLIKTAMKLNDLDSNPSTEKQDLKIEDYKKFGEKLEHLKSLKNQDEEMEVVGENLPEETIVVPVDVIIQEDAGSSSQINKRRIKTSEELEILKEVFDHTEDLPKDVAKRLSEDLIKLHNSWSPTKVRNYWYDNVKEKINKL
ncbi:8292_t:CDS:2, partial [Entrophospora sp. SA101]